MHPTDVALLIETILKSHERFFIQNYHVYEIDCLHGLKERTNVVRKDIPRNQVDLPPLDTTEATGICIPNGNSEVLLAADYKPLGKAWSDAHVFTLLHLRHKTLLEVGLNARNPVCNSQVSNPSGEKFLILLNNNDFQISGPQSSTYYTPRGNGDVLHVVIHQNIHLPNITVSDVMDSDHLPIFFHILEHVSARNILTLVEIHTD
jgi:hypothetical protein